MTASTDMAALAMLLEAFADREESGSSAEIPMCEQAASDAEPDWRDSALCAQVDPEVFYPDKGMTGKEAKRICQHCEVRVQCLEEAQRQRDDHGIWGGLSREERRLLRLAPRNTTDQEEAA
jgi:WhiB family transcriptional regulator, redox-sensing transcriptional regulator